MEVKELMAESKRRLCTNDPIYSERVDVVLALLRAFGILSHSRLTINGRLHRLFAGAIVSAYENKTSVDLYSRRAIDLHDNGLTTRIISWLDKCVKHEVLVPTAPVKIAKGKLNFGSILLHYLDYAKLQLQYKARRGAKNIMEAA